MPRAKGATRPFPNRDEYSGRGRPSKPLVTRAAVVEAALSLVDERGQDALSMRQLADRLGLEAVSSLYNHFKNKTEIKTAVARRIVSDIPHPHPGEVGPKWMLSAIVTYRTALIAHPHAISLVVETAPRDFAATMFEYAAAQMAEAGVGPDHILALLDALESLAVGSAISSTTGRSAAEHDNATWVPPLENLTLDADGRFELVCRSLIETFYTAI